MLKLNNDRLERVMLYLSQAMVDNPGFDRVALGAACYFVDLLAFGQIGHSITTSTYVKTEYEAMPETMESAVTALVEERRAALCELRDPKHYGKQKLIPRERETLSIFSTPERHIIETVIAILRGGSLAGIAQIVQKTEGWQSTGLYQVIPMAASAFRVLR